MTNSSHNTLLSSILMRFERKPFKYCRSFFRISVLITILLINSCKEEIDLPTIRSSIVVEITRNSATAGGEIIYDGGSPIVGKGVCWSVSHSPDFTDHFTANGEGTGFFSTNITGLIPNTIYYVRAYATNSIGTAFGEEVSFTTAPVVLGAITTAQPTSIARTTAISGGEITFDGGGEITQRGVCWDTSPEPDTSDFRTKNGTGKGEFESTITGLSQGTKYYVRAYAINSAGIAYGNQLCFNTKIADIQGNLYNTVSIGSQVWMSENLRTTRYNNNTLIPNVKENADWINLTTPGYCWFANDISKANWGALYNWYTVNTGKLCPTGWHVPTDSEFKTMELNLDMLPDQVDSWYWRGTDQGSRIKNGTGWQEGENGTNSSGFSALPYGYRYAATGAFNDLGRVTYWWSSEYNTDYAWYRRVDGNESKIYRFYTSKKGGKYVRCIKTE